MVIGSVRLITNYPGVDQFGRSPDLGSGGHRFESCYSDVVATDVWILVSFNHTENDNHMKRNGGTVTVGQRRRASYPVTFLKTFEG